MPIRVIYIIKVLFISGALYAQINTVYINLEQKFQTIDNFGASDCWSMQKIGAWVTPQKERVADLLFSKEKGIGLSAWRFNLGAGLNLTTIHHPWRTVETFEVASGEYDWTRQAEERWFLQAAKERGVDQFIAFVNSPPGRLTKNGFTNCTDGLGSTNLKSDYENQFATYLVDILKHFRDEWHLSFDYISPVNEPQWEWNYESNQEGNRASNADIKKIVDELYLKLHDENLETEIILIESGDLKSWYLENTNIGTKYGSPYGKYLELMTHAEMQPKIGSIFGGHSYRSDRVSTQLVQDRENLAEYFTPLLNQGWKYWMTEYAVLDGPEGAGGRGRDLTMNTALDVARVIHYDLTILQASAWQWWTAVSPEDYKDGLIYIDYLKDINSQNIIESKILWALGNFSRYIRPGSVRIKLSGADDKYGLLGSAYLNPDQNQLIIVFINMSRDTKTISLHVTGFSSQKNIKVLTPYVTSDNPGDDLKKYHDFDLDSIFFMPARSIVTVLGNIEDSTMIGNLPVFDSSTYQLFQNYPNPFSKTTLLIYYLPERSQVSLTVFSISGEKVIELTKEEKSPGIHYLIWEGKNNQNHTVSSGVYVYTLQAGKHHKSKKMMYVQ